MFTKRPDGYREEDAEDVASITFAKAYEEFGVFDAAQSDIRTWLTNILKNAYIDWRRTENVRCPSEAASLDEVDYDDDAPSAVGLEVRSALSDANWYQAVGRRGERGRVFLLAEDFKRENPKEIKEVCERVCTSEEIEIIRLFNSGYSFLDCQDDRPYKDSSTEYHEPYSQ